MQPTNASETTTTPANNGATPTAATALACPHCNAPRTADATYCGDCGCVFSSDGDATASAVATPTAPPPPAKVKDRYEIGKPLGERGEVSRYQGKDLSGAQPVKVVIVRAKAAEGAAPPSEPMLEAEVVAPGGEEPLEAEILPAFDEPPAAAVTEGGAAWPSIAWEKGILEAAQHPAVPTIVDHFVEDGWEYLVEEVATGESLWDAWDANTNEKRFGWLIQVAEGMHKIVKAGAIYEFIRPDIVVIDANGQARLTDLSDLLPLPLPPSPPLRGTLYTAPELLGSPEKADARSSLYSFGAMIYSLFMGRELTDMDFEKGGRQPKPFIPRFPDCHPTFGRLITKTFIRELDYRFPSDEASKTDATGFTELIRTLDVCKQTLDDVHLEIASWTTTGMIRTGNEDAFGLMHAAESKMDDMNESALLLLADGMGGYDAGEVASTLCIQTLRKLLLQNKMFAALSGDTHSNQTPFELEACKKIIYEALKETNKVVFSAPTQGIGKRGMGCTAEVVYLNGRNVVVGHVGDSRTYHLHQNEIVQLTRDQTLVNRLVELGQISAAEAETHPRRSELQQAIGGRATVEPAMYHGILKAGDWVLVCSDGLTNHINAEELKQMMLMEAGSAEIAARRLVNFVNIRGATDNSTVVVVRAT